MQYDLKLISILPLSQVFEKVPVQPKSIPPKIVVLGATGKIGRRVIRQLMALESDIKIVAFVRDYEKACDVLYDELLIERSNKGPNLQLVVLDLVPSCSVAGYKSQESDDEDDDDDEEFAVSASKFYDNDLGEYDFRTSKEDNEKDLDPFLPLQGKYVHAAEFLISFLLSKKVLMKCRSFRCHFKCYGSNINIRNCSSNCPIC